MKFLGLHDSMNIIRFLSIVVYLTLQTVEHILLHLCHGILWCFDPTTLFYRFIWLSMATSSLPPFPGSTCWVCQMVSLSSKHTAVNQTKEPAFSVHTGRVIQLTAVCILQMDYYYMTENRIVISLNWTVSLKSLEMTFVGIWHFNHDTISNLSNSRLIQFIKSQLKPTDCI